MVLIDPWSSEEIEEVMLIASFRESKRRLIILVSQVAIDTNTIFQTVGAVIEILSDIWINMQSDLTALGKWYKMTEESYEKLTSGC